MSRSRRLTVLCLITAACCWIPAGGCEVSSKTGDGRPMGGIEPSIRMSRSRMVAGDSVGTMVFAPAIAPTQGNTAFANAEDDQE